MVTSRWVRVGVGLSAIGLLSGCGPVPVPDDPRLAEVTVSVWPDGDSHVELLLASTHEDEVPGLAEDAGPALFPRAGLRPRVNGNDGGTPYAEVSADDVYQPGDAPVVDLAMNELLKAVWARHVSRIDLRVCHPYVPVDWDWNVAPTSEASGCAKWELEPGTPAPTVSLAMHPEPSRAWLALGLIGISLVASVVTAGLAARRPRRWRTLLRISSIAGIVTAAAGIATAFAATSDNLGVAGDLDGAPLLAASIAHIAALLLGLMCIAGLAISLSEEPPPPTNIRSLH